MKSLHGTIRLVSEDTFYWLGRFLFLYITIPLTVFWLLIGNIFEFGSDVVAAISGPTYGFILLFPFIGYKSMYSVAIGLGSTRVQLLKVFCSVGVIGVVLSVIFLNVLQFILKTSYIHWGVEANILHPGQLFFQDYHFFSFLWIDLIFGLYLFGVTFLLYSIIFRLGMRKCIIIMMVLSLIVMYLYYGGYLTNSIDWFLELDFDALGMKLISLLGLVGVGALLLSYPIMRNAPLKPKSRKD